MMTYDFAFAGGEAEFRKALELDPSDATVHQWFAEALAFLGGRAQESIDEANRAHQLDLLSPIIGHALAEVHYIPRQFDKAIEFDKRVIADIPNFPAAHDGLATSYRGQRKYPQVIEQYKLAGLAHKNQAELGAAMDEGFHSAGWPGALHKAIEISLAQRKSTAEYVSPYGIAQLNAI